MKRTPVKSNNIISVGHDPETKTLEVEFKNGGVYRYADVDAERHSAMMKADSVGAFLHAHIKGKHAHSKVGGSDT